MSPYSNEMATNEEAQNLEIGTGFSPEQSQEMQYRAQTSRSAGGDVECLDMEIVIGDQKEMISVYPDSDINALA